MIVDRRRFLKTAAVTGAAALSGSAGLAADFATWAGPFQGKQAPPLHAKTEPPGAFDFIFFTDTHIEPELDAAHGCDMCFRKIASIKSNFAIMGGDHVYDALGVDGTRAGAVYDLYKKTQQMLQMPIYHAIGNHDVFGILTKSGVRPSDPAYGKKIYEDRIGKTYYSFDHKGYHFVVLDSIEPTEDRLWEGRVEERQLRWLVEDLKAVVAGTPVVATVHVPLVTGFATYAEKPAAPPKYNTLTVENAPQVLAAFEGHNLIAVLQGHTHVNEVVDYKNTKFITSGAVCGNWWHGPRMGFPEGFSVVSLREGKISTRYETYGFKSVDPREKF